MATSNYRTQKYFDLYATNDCELYDEDFNEFYFDNWLYEDIKSQLDKFNNKLQFFDIELKDGYYNGLQTFVTENNKLCYYDYNALYMLENYKDLDGKEIYNTYGFNKYILKKKILKAITNLMH